MTDLPSSDAPRSLRPQPCRDLRGPSPWCAAFIVCWMLALLSPAAQAVDLPDALTRGRFSVASRTFTVVDETRQTDAHSGHPALPHRELHATVWYPAERRRLERLHPGVTPAAQGPHPLIIYSHGFSSFRSEGRYLARNLASRGYVVISADFPLTQFTTKGGPVVTDVVNQPGDVSLLISTALAWSDDPAHFLSGKIDSQRIGAVGLSLGGLTTTLVAFHPTLRDPRVRVAVSMAGPAFMFDTAFFADTQVPYMVLGGTLDALVDYPSNAAPLRERAPETTLVTLDGGSHLGFTADARLLFPWRHHPDALACRIVDARLPQDDNRMSFVTVLGGPEIGIIDTPQTHFCELDPLPRAMRPRHQLKLSEAAIVPFLDIHLDLDPELEAYQRAYLYRDLAASNPRIHVEPALEDEATQTPKEQTQ